MLLILSVTIYVTPRLKIFPDTVCEGWPDEAPKYTAQLTVEEVQTYFTCELAVVPEQAGATALYRQPATLDDAEDCEVAVTALDHGSIAVAFRGSGEKALNVARKFCGSSLFQPAETAALLEMVEHRYGWPSTKLRRFQVVVRELALIDQYQVTIQFSP